MQTTRRKFILTGSAAMMAGTLERAAAQSPSGQNIRSLLESQGFNPDGSNSALLAVIGDPHICLAPELPKYWTEKWDDDLISEINSVQPLVTDLIIAGDLISHHSASTGASRYPSIITRSRDEFRLAKNEISRFRPGMRIWAVPGNHDTDAYDIDADLWREEMQLPAYQKAVLGGVPVFLLNSGNGGMLNTAQLAWFREEVKTIPKHQDVLVIAHHPSFYYKWLETGLRRILVEIFEGHQGVVWVVGGHGHSFGDQLYKERATRFIQMAVTAANPKANNDGNAPGYALIALQDGKLFHRLFRSLKASGFQSLPAASKMPAAPARWAFDEVTYPAEIFEEGFYDRTNRLIAVNGVDVGCHFVYCKSMTLRASLSRFQGKVDTFVLGAEINASTTLSPTCSFSLTGQDGTWVSAPFPAAKGSALYHVPIPVAFQNATDLYIRLTTSLTNYYYGFSVCGWALAANGDRLSAYEKWISRRYRTLADHGPSSPDSITPLSNQANIVNFGFNLPTSFSGPVGTSASLPPASSIKGLPEYSQTFRKILEFRFARRSQDSNPGINYQVEESADMVNWTKVSDDRLVVTLIEPGWEEVALTLAPRPGFNRFCRVRVEGMTPAGGKFKLWTQQMAVVGSNPDDLNGDGIDDLLQFAFDLNPNKGDLRPYDRARPSGKAGIPVLSSRVARLSRLVYPRMASTHNPGIKYMVEASTNLSHWRTLAESEYSEQVLGIDGEWERVELLFFDTLHQQRFYRIKLELENPSLP